MEPFCEQSEQYVSRAGLSEGQWERVIMEGWKNGRLGDCEKGRLGAYEKSVGRSSLPE